MNTIDVVFADNHAVREAWTRYIATLNDPNLNVGVGFAIRDEKRRELLLEIVKTLGRQQKISSAELLRAYMPTFVVESAHLAMVERTYKRALYEEYLRTHGIPFPPWVPPLQDPHTGNSSGPTLQRKLRSARAPVTDDPSSAPNILTAEEGPG